MKTNKLTLTLLIVVLMATITACSLPLLVSPTGEPFIPDTGLDGDLDARMTEVAQNVEATLAAAATNTLVNPTNTPEPTSTPLPTNTLIPTNTPAPTNTPVPTSPPLPCNAASFVADMTVADGAAVPKGSSFVKIWRLKNSGSCTWTKDYEVTFDGGDKLGGKTISLPKSVSPGESVDIAIAMKAPDTTGKYKGFWILRNQNGVKFGLGASADGPFYVEIRVVGLGNSVKYNLANQLCSAEWKTDSHTLPCLGNSQVYSNYVFYSSDFKMEGGRVEDEPAIIANVETGQRLRGIFPAYTVASGDRFVSEIGCTDVAKDCKVKMVLHYRIKGTSTQGILGEWIEKYDGKTTLIEIDLSSLAGKDVIFTLDMEAKSGSDTNEVFWFMPSIREVDPENFEHK
ncbi:MAG: hypothetical protein JW757_09370 [Anaerolineales bacterium]|nr:hypothetical protein [Anaerolineales bacterium]